MPISVPGSGQFAVGKASTLGATLGAKIAAMAPKSAGSGAPPPQYYDPGLDLSAAQAKQGAQYQQDDYGYDSAGNPTGTNSERNQDDYYTAQGLQQQGYQNSLSDLLTASTRGGQDFAQQRADTQRTFGYSMADLLTGRTREGEDYTNALTNLDRTYSQLGDSQTQATQAAGAAGGGALAASLAARTSNEAIDRAPIDLSHTRYGQDADTQTSRLNDSLAAALASIGSNETRFDQDQTTAQSRLDQSNANATGANAQAYDRTTQDYTTQNTRTQQDLATYLQGILGTQWQQAYQNNYPG